VIMQGLWAPADLVVAAGYSTAGSVSIAFPGAGRSLRVPAAGGAGLLGLLPAVSL
jgi:hypothetical protein